MENSKTISTHGMSDIVTELSDQLVLWADVGVVRGSHSSLLGVVPETISIRTSSVVSSEDVVGMCDPEAGGSLISVQQ